MTKRWRCNRFSFSNRAENKDVQIFSTFVFHVIKYVEMGGTKKKIIHRLSCVKNNNCFICSFSHLLAMAAASIDCL